MTFVQAKKKYDRKEVNILGTKYKTLFITTDYLNKKSLMAEIHYAKKLIFVDENLFKNNGGEGALMQLKETLRHEIVHGFMEESGLNEHVGACTEHGVNNEDCVQWFAMQGPKMFKVFKELEVL